MKSHVVLQSSSEYAKQVLDRSRRYTERLCVCIIPQTNAVSASEATGITI